MDERMRDRDRDVERLSDDANRPSTNPAVGGAVGGASGAVAGAAAGTLTAGPVGTIVGAIVGAVGGGWAGIATSREAGPSDEDEAYYRVHYGEATKNMADASSYDRVRPAYHLGHYAGLNTDYDGRTFDEVERDLRYGWSDDVRARHGEWERVRPYVRAAYERTLMRRNANPGSMRPESNLGGTPSHQRAEFNDRLAPDAPVAGNPNVADATPGASEHSGSPPWMEHASDQGGFGAHIEPRHSDRAEPER